MNNRPYGAIVFLMLIHRLRNMSHSLIAGSMLDYRLRRWTNIDPTMGEYVC